MQDVPQRVGLGQQFRAPGAHWLDRRDRRATSVELRPEVVNLAAVEVAIRCDEDARLDLAESVEHPGHAGKEGVQSRVDGRGIRRKPDGLPQGFTRTQTFGEPRDAAADLGHGVALAAEIPFVSTAEYSIRLPGRDSIPALRGGGPFVSAVSHEYFDVVRTPVVQGRAFASSDRAGNEPVAIVNETAARTLWGSESALGQCVFVSESESCATIVGIASDTKRMSLQDEPAIQVYVPRDQQAIGDDPRFVIRARGDVTRVTAKVRQELLRLDPTILYIYVDQPHNELETQARPWRLGAIVFMLFGALALIVAAVGLYSVVSYAVAQRTQEIGVRMALGAQPGAITWMALSDAFVLAGTGVIIGLVSTLIAGRYVAPLLFETSPTDPYVMIVVTVVMMLVTLAAAAAPALRARRINPIEALRLDS